MSTITIRAVIVNGVSYLRAEDVANYLRELAATEETIVRSRLHAAAQNLQNTKP